VTRYPAEKGGRTGGTVKSHKIKKKKIEERYLIGKHRSPHILQKRGGEREDLGRGGDKKKK